MSKKVLGIIVARGGSKSIPRKNIKLFAGKPLIAWSIEVGLKSKILDKIIVSTDDDEISSISKEYGAEVPFIRPSELATDSTPTLPVLQHAVSYLKDNDYVPDYVLLLEPTSPCRQTFHLQEAYKIISETDADSVVSLGEVPLHYNHSWQFVMNEDKKIKLHDGTEVSDVIHQRQQLSKTYFRNGAFYLFKTELLFANKPSLYGKDVRGYVIDSQYSVDIDTPQDWEEAERKLLSIIN